MALADPAVIPIACSTWGVLAAFAIGCAVAWIGGDTYRLRRADPDD